MRVLGAAAAVWGWECANEDRPFVFKLVQYFIESFVRLFAHYVRPNVVVFPCHALPCIYCCYEWGGQKRGRGCVIAWEGRRRCRSGLYSSRFLCCEN